MKSRTIAFAIGLMACLAYGDIVFDVSFDGPDFIAGSTSPTGIPPDYPQYAPSLIVDSAAFGSQVARPGYLRFDPESIYASGVHNISWRYLSEDNNTYGGWPNMAVTFSGSSVFLPNGSSPGDAYFYIDGNPLTTAPTPLNQVHDYAVTINLESLTASFFVNGVQFATNAPIPSGATLDYVLFQVPGNNTAYIDNFRWEIVPEPSSLILITLGFAAMMAMSARGHR